MMTTTYKPREVSKIDATIFRELIFSKRALAVFPKDPAKKITFFEPDSSNAIDKKFSFLLEVGQQKVDLSIELKPGTPLAKRLEEVGGLESLPEEFRVALMTFASQEIINAVEQLFQLPVKVSNDTNTQEESSEKKELYFEILDAQGKCEARASIMLSIPLLERVLAVAQETPATISHSLTGELLQAEVFVGSATVTLEDWNALNPGDLIVIQEPSALTAGEATCFIKKSGIIPVTVKPDFLKPLIQPLGNFFPADVKPVSPASEEVKLTAEAEGGAPSEKLLGSTSTGNLESREATASIPLELNFSAGVLSLTLEEALQLMKNKALEKPFQLLKPLKIFIQEQLAGTGELVEIGGRYAVVVTQTATKQV